MLLLLRQWRCRVEDQTEGSGDGDKEKMTDLAWRLPWTICIDGCTGSKEIRGDGASAYCDATVAQGAVYIQLRSVTPVSFPRGSVR